MKTEAVKGYERAIYTLLWSKDYVAQSKPLNRIGETMRIKLWCTTHEADVIPAGYSLTWLPKNSVDVDNLVKPTGHIYASEFELDYADLYCTGGKGDHNFTVTLEEKKKDCMYCVGIEGMHTVRNCIGETEEEADYRRNHKEKQ